MNRLIISSTAQSVNNTHNSNAKKLIPTRQSDRRMRSSQQLLAHILNSKISTDIEDYYFATFMRNFLYLRFVQ